MAGRFNPEMVESLNRNHWSICPGITGRFAPESVVDLGRNTQRSDHLQERGRLNFIIGKTGFGGTTKTYTLDSFYNKYISENLKKQNKIFENNTGIIYNFP